MNHLKCYALWKGNTTKVITSCFLFFCFVCVFLDTQLCLFDVLSLHEHFLNGPLPLELQRAMERAVMPGPPSAPQPAVGAEADAGGAKL